MGNLIQFVTNEIPPITIVGAGGIGCSLAATIHHSKHPVKLVEKCEQKIAWSKANGVKVSGFSTQKIPIESFDSWQPTANEAIFLCTKRYSNKSVLTKIPKNSLIIPIQNGFEENEQSSLFKIEGIASFIAESPHKNTDVKITRPGSIHFGINSGISETFILAKNISKIIKIPGVKLKLTKSILKYKSTKLLYNCAISPLASGCGVDNGQLLANPQLLQLFLGLLRENLGILHHAKMELGKVGPFAPKTVVAILRRPWVTKMLAGWFKKSLDNTYCSMACDWLSGQTELENYLGYLLQIADGYPAPLNKALYQWCKNRLEKRQLPSMELIDFLENSADYKNSF